MKSVVTTIILIFTCHILIGQTGVGLGLYPTGTESGLGFRLNKDKKVYLDARVTRANFYSDKTTGQTNFLTELSAIYRLILLEKVRFHMGLGFRGDWNLVTSHKYGVVMPIGVEAFPFPFQNAGLIFETAPFCVSDSNSKLSGGIRTIAGFVFYFPTNKNSKKDK
ncbi:MAG: hypothetical protein Q8M29_05175 [Bacteroidota bacterium]|nr:hypothetical protein [Bacteroidota bacterium]